MKYALGILLLALGFLGCASKALVKRESFFERSLQIPIGAGLEEIRRRLGEPTETGRENELLKITYSMQYRNRLVPEGHFWVDSSNRVVAKHINLIDQSIGFMNIKDIEQKVGKLRLVDQTNLSGHSIPAYRDLIDSDAGIQVVVNSSQNNRVFSLSWFSRRAEGAASVK